jgi:hypothetical protein
MAPRDLMSSAAMDTVFGNLGMGAEDLGMQDADFGNDLDGDDGVGGDGDSARAGADDFDQDDAGQDDDPFAIDDGFEDPQDRVSHTPRDRQQPQDRRQPQRAQPRFQARDQQAARKFKPDAKGNVVNGQNEIVARAGKEARIFWNGEKHRKASERAQTQLRDTAGRLNRVTTIAERLYADNNAYKAQRQAIEQLGIKPEEQISAMQLYTQLLAKPKETIQKLLTRAAANGITIDSTPGGNNNGQPDIVNVVKELLGTEIKPLKEFVTSQQARDTAQREHLQARQAVQTEVETWFGQNPEARPHAQVIQRVLRDPRYSNMSLGEVWARIQLHQARNPSKRGLRDSMNGSRRSTSRHRGSPPTGRGMPPMGTSQMADVNESWDTIVRETLDANGVV